MGTGPSRRVFITGLAGSAGTLLLEGSSSAFQSNPQRIDVHHHVYPPAYISIAKENGITINPANNWTLEKTLEDMDKAGTARAITSITTPGLWFGNAAVSRRLSRECNEYSTKIIRDYPGRFGLFAALPLPDIDGSLKEIEYALDVLKADGICMHTVYQDKATGIEDRFLGHPMFDPIHQELNRRKAVVYTHPKEADCCRNMVPGVAATIIEYGTNTTRTIASLIFSGTTSKYPDEKWILSHAGGTMPFLIERFLNGTAEEVVPGIVTKGQGGSGVVSSNRPAKVPKGVLYELRQMYYDCAQTSNPVAMRALRTVVPVSQIVFGTDFPFRTTAETAKGLDTCGVFNAAEIRAINRENAMKLLGRKS
jgi:predicted TIM-barrel fold metal-dependent hydrolase